MHFERGSERSKLRELDPQIRSHNKCRYCDSLCIGWGMRTMIVPFPPRSYCNEYIYIYIRITNSEELIMVAGTREMPTHDSVEL